MPYGRPLLRIRFLGILFMLMLLVSCATHYSADAVEEPYGFFSGFWHGLIFFFAVITNLLSWMLGLFGISFLDSIQIIGRPNTGFWYYVGFLFGLGASGGSASR